MSIMMRIASDLEADWSMYDKDAFVNAWDVANYVSDYLTKKSGSEGCECSSQIYWKGNIPVEQTFRRSSSLSQAINSLNNGINV